MSTYTHFIVLLIWACLAGCYSAYFCAAVNLWVWRLLRLPKDGSILELWMNIVWHITRWPCLVYLVSDPLFAWITDTPYTWVNALFDTLGGFAWWFTRHLGDDDDWKKLKDHIKGKVKVIRRKLVIVPPTPEPA